jgi:hypothetical protein
VVGKGTILRHGFTKKFPGLWLHRKPRNSLAGLGQEDDVGSIY